MNIEPIPVSESESVLATIIGMQEQIMKSLMVPQAMVNEPSPAYGTSPVSSVYKIWWLKEQMLKLHAERTRLRLAMTDYAMELLSVVKQLPEDFVNRENTAAGLINGFETFLQGIAKYMEQNA